MLTRYLLPLSSVFFPVVLHPISLLYSQVGGQLPTDCVEARKARLHFPQLIPNVTDPYVSTNYGCESGILLQLLVNFHLARFGGVSAILRLASVRVARPNAWDGSGPLRFATKILLAILDAHVSMFDLGASNSTLGQSLVSLSMCHLFLSV